MTGPTAISGVHMPSLSAELPGGWAVIEGATFVGPSGTKVHVSAWQDGPELDPAALMDHQLAAAQAETAGLDSLAASTLTWRGVVAQQRRFTFDRDGATMAARMVCAVDGDTALTVSAAWAADDDAGDTEMDQVLAGIRLLSRPILPANDNSVRPDAPARRRGSPAAVDVSVWSGRRVDWAESSPAEAAMSSTARWSPQELAVGAVTMGSAWFPTVGHEVLTTLPEVALSAMAEAVKQSLMARDLLDVREDGTTTPAGELREITALAVNPDLAITVERISAGEATMRWFGLQPEHAVEVVVLPDGLRQCGVFETTHMVSHLLAFTDTGPNDGVGLNGPNDTGPRTVTLDEVHGGYGDVTAVVQVTTTWRADGLLVGGILSWAIGTDGRLWLAEQTGAIDGGQGETTMAWELHPTDLAGLRAELLAHLPGA